MVAMHVAPFVLFVVYYALQLEPDMRLKFVTHYSMTVRTIHRRKHGVEYDVGEGTRLWWSCIPRMSLAQRQQ